MEIMIAIIVALIIARKPVPALAMGLVSSMHVRRIVLIHVLETHVLAIAQRLVMALVQVVHTLKLIL